jgi:hypothetical protein
MSCAAIAFEAPAGIFQSVNSDGVSNEANRVQELVHQACQDLLSSVSLGYSRETCRNQLIEVSQRATTKGWDGYDAAAVQPNAVINAYTFIDALPSNVPMPEVAVDPDGEISLDWFSASRRQFSVSVGANNVLSYAGLFGHDKVSGSERFQGTVPRGFLDYIKRSRA